MGGKGRPFSVKKMCRVFGFKKWFLGAFLLPFLGFFF
jgi:hypothetical protein